MKKPNPSEIKNLEQTLELIKKVPDLMTPKEILKIKERLKKLDPDNKLLKNDD